MKDGGVCINPECNGTEYARGLCESCHRSAFYLMKSGQITMKELEASGRILPKATKKHGPVRRQRLDWFRAARKKAPVE